MSNTPDMRAINQQVITEFRANDGRLSGPMAGAPILLLTTSGRRSGQPHTTPVGFIEADDGLAIAAANGGAPNDPHWFTNLNGDEPVTVELPGATVKATATVAAGEQRQQLLAELCRTLPGMSDHVSSCDRDIPVVVLNKC